ncbi:MAG: hypothetical protein NTW03_11730 [Verrucomicrobia bacterium]|nr:hypothetical protein [Verrucomicrobiota bacterium]
MVIDWKDRRAATALRAFEPLGPKAASAIPDITRLLKDAKSSEMACRAVRILAFIGRDALGPLIDALTKQTGLVRRSILYLITTEDCLRTNARPFIPAFVRCLNDPDRVVGTKAAILLGKLKGDPEIVLPALVKSLQDSRGDVRRE